MTTDVPSVVRTADGSTVVFRGRNLYSPTTPRQSCLRRVEALTILDRSLILVPSPLVGHGLEQLLDKCGPGCGVFLVELEPQLAQLARRQLPSELLSDPRVHLCVADSLERIEACFPLDQRARYERVVLVNLSAGSRLHSAEYNRLQRWLQDEIRRSWQNRITTMQMGRLWFRNLFANLPLLPASRSLASLRVNAPALVVGAGPSLEPIVAELREHRSSLFLIAVDTAAPLLAAHGISADAVVAVEPQHANLGDFVGIERSTPLLIADLFSYPAAVRLFPPRNRLFFASRPVQNRLLDRLHSQNLLPRRIPPLGSVGVAAVYLAHAICNTPVAFAGLDFAYPDGKTHARGAPMLLNEMITRERLSGDRIYPACLARPRLTMPDKAGGTCRTDMVLLSYAEQLQSFCGSRPDVFDLGATGLATGAPRLSGIEEFLARAAVAPGSGPSSATDRSVALAGRAAARPAAARAVRQALSRERDIIAGLEAGIGLALGAGGHHGSSTTTDAALQLLLGEADYVCAESTTAGPVDQQALRRTLATVRYYRLQIDRALDRLTRFSHRRT